MKAPNVDGMQAIFLHRSSNIIGEYVYNMVRLFFTFGHMLNTHYSYSKN